MNDIDISVGRIDGLETMLDCDFLTTNFTSLRKLTQLFCEMNEVSMSDIEDYSVSQITAWCLEFLRLMRVVPTDTSIYKGYILKPITIQKLLEMEDALGMPIYGGVDFDRISNQLKCVAVGYGLPTSKMAAIRKMPYPDYFAHIWMPLSTEMAKAMAPQGEEEKNEKNLSED